MRAESKPISASPFQILQNAGASSDGRGGLGSVDLDLIRGKDDPTTYFSDGVRKIDFVLVFEEKQSGAAGLSGDEEDEEVLLQAAASNR